MAENDNTQLVRDLYRYNDSVSKEELRAAQARYDYLLQRRDQVNDRIRNGTIALNAVALLGVLTALSTDLVSGGSFGVSPGDLAFSASCFMVGLILAVVGIAAESWRIPGEAATQFALLSHHRRQRGVLDSAFRESSHEELTQAMEEIHELQAVDFEWSSLANWATNLSAGAWLAGMLLPLWKITELIAW